MLTLIFAFGIWLTGADPRIFMFGLLTLLLDIGVTLMVFEYVDNWRKR